MLIEESPTHQDTLKSNAYAIAYLTDSEGHQLPVILDDEDIEITGDYPGLDGGVEVKKGTQTRLLLDYLSHQPTRDKAINGWNQFLNYYRTDANLKSDADAIASIERQIERLEEQEAEFFASLPEGSYVAWYLPLHKLVNSAMMVAQYQVEEIPAYLEAFRAVDFADDRLYHSDLIKPMIERHIWFIENTCHPLDSVFVELNRSIDLFVEQLKDDEERLNLIAEEWFKVLEKRSLFRSSEYIANKLLGGTEVSCVNEELKHRMGKYTVMDIGQTAPNFEFSPYTYYPEGVNPAQLSEVDADQILLVFAAGWCAHCTRDVPEIAAVYEQISAAGAEVVLASLDESPQEFIHFAAPLPFITTTDFKKWESPLVYDYHVYGTPTYFVLDRNLKILHRPNTLQDVKNWVDSLGSK